jgi:hypothetical protein
VESHISRKTSEMPGFPVRGTIQQPRVRLSLRKAAGSSSTPTNLTGNPGVWGTRRPLARKELKGTAPSFLWVLLGD